MAKNSEVYKTAQERAKAFYEYCKQSKCPNKKSCSHCCGIRNYIECGLEWLDLEAEDEPQESFEDLLKEVREFADSFIVNGEDKGLENPCDTLHEIADRFEAAHNRVAKAVKESEVK